ncbi:MAG TPA: sigma 54-interacting transcriptional regulator [Minicystis sp.]|nr:sigma 54-interacting transcriptional regulator [Minicystis sp.]
MPRNQPPPEDERDTHVLQGDGALRIAAVDVVVVEGPDRGLSARLAPVVVVGTGPGAQLRLRDPAVSRLQCEIAVAGGRITLRDHGSTNGTFVEGYRVRDVDLTPGAVVRVGSTVLRLEGRDEPETVSLSTRTSFGSLVGGSVEMRRIYAVLERIAPTDATVLVEGETGTGKELVARSIHEASRRAQMPFVTVDCGALPENLIESELFGHVRGAFTGAVGDRTGAFEEAHGGTLFLDEIGELPLALQPKLLRALESRTVRRIGSNKARPVDLRVIAATNRNLVRAVNEGIFREDLYYRLAVIEVRLPPLRARREDLPLLAAHLIERFTGTASPAPPAMLDALFARSWPGNVRELKNFVERSISLGWPPAAGAPTEDARRAASILPSATDALVPVHLPMKEAKLAWMDAFESVYVRALLEKTGGNVTRAAALAGISRRFFQVMLARTRGNAGAGDEG